ncbi:Hypothetical predicted protein, partial [Pelobates cultripes]
MKQRFLDKGYPEPLLGEAMNKALAIPRQDTLHNKTKTSEPHNVAPAFITKYNHQSHTIQKILRKHQGILKNDPTLSKFLDDRPQIIFTKASNLQLMLAPTIKFFITTNSQESIHGFTRCVKCKNNPSLVVTTTGFSTLNDKEEYNIT